MTAFAAPRASVRVHGLLGVVAVLAAVEVASGAIQGYYGPVMVDIADGVAIGYGDLNWLEASQLIFSALVVVPLARLGDLVGHRTVLLGATAVTAVATWGIALAPSFPVLLAAWTLQGVYVVWLPIEVAIIHRRTAGSPRQGRTTRRVAALLVATLELSIILAAVLAGQLAERVSLTTMLTLPAVAVTLCVPALWWLGDTPRRGARRFDGVGLGLLVLAVSVTMAGLVLVRLQGVSSPIAWLLVLAGCLLLVPWWRHEHGHTDPLVDVRLLADPAQWGIQLTALLLGMSLLGAQVPLSTYFRSDPAVTGYGFGISAAEGSLRLTSYVACLAIGALALPLTSRVFGPRGAMVVGCLVYAAGYAAWLPLHGSEAGTWLLMAVVGLGAGGLVAGIPAAAVAAAPPDRVGSVTGLTNAAKAIGGGLASAVFAICLASTGTLRIDGGSLGGYYAVWSICAGSGLLAAAVLALTARTVRPTRPPRPAGGVPGGGGSPGRAAGEDRTDLSRGPAGPARSPAR
ncbi:MFS transporter [Nocardioides sp. zg-ZUI104]|uniref:MFS transporter n=1 Tax=Nocardioides faecalis TaxID=2803858 RepID=UPI001BCD9AC5|nr:MFS transporter [Nocardioides faecalis]MBS4752815.1 MFS transporter [Nocardioides faecalis]